MRWHLETEKYSLYISDWVRAKLDIHGVSEQEVEEAFFNSSGLFVKEVRREHRTRPPTFWFISLTCDGRPLKIAFIPVHEDGILVLKTSFQAELWEIEEYESFAK